MLGNKTKLCMIIGSVLGISGCFWDDNNSSPTVSIESEHAQTYGQREITIQINAADPDGDTLSFQWEQLQGTSQLDLSNVDESGNLTLRLPELTDTETFVLQVTVSDGEFTVTDSIEINADKSNPIPTAKIIGKDIIARVLNWPIANQANLSVLSSDGSVGVNPKWRVTQAPDDSLYQITSQNSLSTGFYADTLGQYTLELILDNEQGLSSTASFNISVIDDLDGDGVQDGADLDADGDGYLKDDLFPADKASHSDSDGDGISNYHDTDEDGDGVADELDGYPFDASTDSWPEHIEASWNNDGISVSETVNGFPAFISGAIQGTNGYDQDYFKLALPEGRVSIQLRTSSEFSGFLTLVNAQGVPVAFIEHSLPNQRIISAVVPSAGNYYFALGSDVSTKIDYQALIFLDSDQDGLSDDLEKALDSNALNSDSDGDGLSDGVEFYGRSTPVLDLDNDGLPSWWDLDSDNDLIADQLEATNIALDVDLDGNINSQDEDSDNNGILDSIEVGDNVLEPANNDGDAASDFVDLDNDNDLIDDKQDNDVNTVMLPSINSALEITEIKDSNGQTTFQCLPTHRVNITLSDGSDLTNLKVIASHQASNVELPHSVNGQELEVNCADLKIGNNLLLITDGATRSGEYPLEVLPEDGLYLSRVSLVNDLLTLEGENLNQAFKLHFPTGVVDINASNGSESRTITLPNDFTAGEVYIDHAHGQTQRYIVSYKNTAEHNVTAQLPDGITAESLYLSTTLNNEVPFTADGATVNIDVAKPEVASLVKYINDELHTIGYVPVLPNTQAAHITSATTAVGYLWYGINYDWSSADAEQTLQDIYALESVQKLGEFIYSGLANDIDYMVSQEIYQSPHYLKALNDIKALLSQSQNAAVQTRSSSQIVITPEEEIDDIGVKIDAKNQFNIENDTRLHLAFQVTDTEGKAICQYGSGMWSSNYVGPQETMWNIASTGVCNGSAVQDSKVRVLSAGIDNSYDAKLTPGQISAHEQNVRQFLVSRTIIDGVVLPQLMFILDNAGLLTISKSKLASIFMQEAPWFSAEVLEFTNGGQSLGEFKTDVVNKLINDFASYGPVTQAIFKEAAKNLTAEALAKLAGNAVKKAIPVLGQLLVVKDLTLAGIDVGKTLTDLSTVDVVLDFEVEVALEIDNVEPAVIMPDEEDKRITITGKGFQPVKPDFWSSKKYPQITLTSTVSGISKSYKPYYINSDGTEMWLYADASLFDTDDDIFDVSVKHLAFDLPAEEAIEAIKVDADLVLTSVSKTQAAANDMLTVTGSGFSKYASENMVMFGEHQVSILHLTSTSVTFRIPKDLEPGTYPVKSKRLDIKNADWSNELQVEVAEADIVITVCDNGGAKDDNFALDVNGQRLGQTATTYSKYCFSFPHTLPTGVHTATLTGLDAPDGIGTYSISFAGVTELSGSPTSGYDLVPGSTPKRYTFKVVQPQAQRMFVIPQSVPSTLGIE